MTSPLIRLRGHHLLCLLTYVGHGYTDAFTACFDRLVHKIGQGLVDIEIVDGADDLCRSLCGEDGAFLHQHAEHTCPSESVRRRDALAQEDVGKVLGKTLICGDRLALDLHVMKKLRKAFQKGSVRRACNGCPWDSFCTNIAANGFTKNHD